MSSGNTRGLELNGYMNFKLPFSKLRSSRCSGHVRKQNEMMRLFLATSIGLVIGFFMGVSSPKLSPGKTTLIPSLFHSINLTYIDGKYTGLLRDAFFNAFFLEGNETISSQNGKHSNTKIWPPKKPRGTESLPPGIIVSESDFYLRRLLGEPHEDLKVKPKYLVTFTVGYKQKDNINKALQKFSQNFTVMLFHYDGRTSEWDEFEWSERAIHISVLKQTKWWYAKRFLHPDIVAAYDYIFIWDEDLGLANFDAEEYLKLVRKHGLEISQPGLEKIGDKDPTWHMTMKQRNTEVHKVSKEVGNWCLDPHVPPCAGFVEIMATVFSRDAWRCVWHMVQNDLVHGWGLDFSLRRCVEPAHEKIGVVDSQWIIHQGIPSLGSQGQAGEGKTPAEAVKDRCYREWEMFTKRMNDAEAAYIQNQTS